MLSAEDGIQRVLLWLTMEADVYWGIMKPLFRPGLATRNEGRPRLPDTNLYWRRSEMLPNSFMAIQRKSMGRAIGSPWKLPAEMMRSSSGQTVGLSVVALISMSTTDFTYDRVSFTAPCTWGMQRKE